MPCTECGSELENVCECENGLNAYGVTSTTTGTLTGTSFTLTMSTTNGSGGAWARPGQIVFVEGFGYYVVSSGGGTSSTIPLQNPITPFVGGAAFLANSVDFRNFSSANGTISSGTKVSPAGLKGTTGSSAVPAIIEEIGHGAYTTQATSFANFSGFTDETIAAGALAEDGDTLEIEAKYYFNGTSIDNARIKVLVDGVNVSQITSTGPDLALSADLPYLNIKVIVTRASATTANVRTVYSLSSFTTSLSYTNEIILANSSEISGTHNLIGVSTITWANAIDVSLQGELDSGSDTLKMGFYSIKNLQQI